MKKRSTCLGLIWGILLVTNDLNNYYIYILLLMTSSAIDCSNYFSYYIIFSFINTILSGVSYPISGYLTDWIHSRQNWIYWLLKKNNKGIRDLSKIVFFLSNVLQLLFILGQLLPRTYPFIFIGSRGWIILCFFWQMSQLMTIQNENSLWKIIKDELSTTESPNLSNSVDNNDQPVDPLVDLPSDQIISDESTNNQPKNSDENLYFFNHIGNIGDLTSDIIESIILGILILGIMGLNYREQFIFLYLTAIIIGLNGLLISVSVWMIFGSPITYYSDSRLYSYSEIKTEFQKLSEMKSVDSSPDSDLLGIPSDPRTKSYFSPFSICKIFWCSSFMSKIKNALSAPGFHVFIHCLLIEGYKTLVEYPLTLKEVDLISTKGTQTLSNLCGNSLLNLFVMGAFSNLFYLLGSITYRLLIVNSSSTFFYRFYYPLFVLILLFISLFLRFCSESWVVLIGISIATIIPYYLTYYDYYFFTNRCRVSSYGLILGVYGGINTVISLVIQLLYYSSLSVVWMLYLSCGILVLTIVYSYYIGHLIKRESNERVCL